MHKYCDGVSRRDALKAGVAGAFGLNLASMLHLDADETASTSGKNAIFVFLTGGQSHMDSWDMKPEAGEMKGEFDSIATNLTELRVCELMPYLAKQADKYTVVRNVSHTQGAHSPGQRYLQTGNRKIPSLEYPDYGAVISKEHHSPRGVPQYVLAPSGGSNSASYSSGYLGVAHGPFTALDITWEIEDAGVREAMGNNHPQCRQSVFLDLKDGLLDMSEKKNIALGRLRDALGLNDPTRPFTFNDLLSQPAIVKIEHSPNPKDAENPYANVTKVAKLG